MYSAVCATSLRDRRRERPKQGANEQERGRWSAREVEIRDGIKYCETDRANEAEKRKTERKQYREIVAE